MHTVRTTQQPYVEIDVDDDEYAQLKTMGLLAEDENTVYVAATESAVGDVEAEAIPKQLQVLNELAEEGQLDEYDADSPESKGE